MKIASLFCALGVCRHSFKTRLGHRLGRGTRSMVEPLGHWSNRMNESEPLG